MQAKLGTFSAVHRSRCLWSVAAFSFLLACGSGEKPAAKKDGAAKKDDAAKKDGAAKKDEPEPAKKDEAAEKHFDVTQDKSGILARSAAALEATEAIADEELAELSHHADKLPSNEEVCKHVIELRGAGADAAACVKDAEHDIVQLGPEVYAQLAACLTEAKTVEELDACDAAEAEAELLLHEKAHGDGLSQEICEAFFAQFEKLAMEDAGDQGELVKEILDEVQVDVLAACVDQGKQAEIDCATEAKTLLELKDCASKLL